jgi:hypothetical protein
VTASPGSRLKLPRERNMTMLVISLLFVLLYVFRETGGVPVVAGLHGVVDDIVVAAATLLAFSAGGASVRTTVVHGGIGLVAIGLAVAESVTEAELLLRSANLVSGYLVLATCIALFGYVLKKTKVTGDTISEPSLSISPLVSSSEGSSP